MVNEYRLLTAEKGERRGFAEFYREDAMAQGNAKNGAAFAAALPTSYFVIRTSNFTLGDKPAPPSASLPLYPSSSSLSAAPETSPSDL